MTRLRAATLVILVVWVLLGPVGMALSGCMMMDGCDALCSVLSVAPMVESASLARVTSVLIPSGAAFYPQNVWSVSESPPRSTPALL
jgi:hypothetical protein